MGNPTLQGRHCAFACFVALVVLAFWITLSEIFQLGLKHDHYSHILVIPAISGIFIYLDRHKIFRPGPALSNLGVTVLLAWLALGMGVQSSFRSLLPALHLALIGVCVVLLWLAGFVFIYGWEAFRAARFPLLLLFLMVPLPDVILGKIILGLQVASTQGAYLLFDLVRVPVTRQGFVLLLPGLQVEVASQCSGIRSSIALFITALLVGHLFLPTCGKKLLLIVLAIPLLIFKNSLRIVVLCLLSLHVDRSFLHGRLHTYGGGVFFLITLMVLAGITAWLARPGPGKWRTAVKGVVA